MEPGLTIAATIVYTTAAAKKTSGASGSRLALIVPDADEPSAKRLAIEVTDELRDRFGARTAATSWRPDDTGEAVIYRARAGLDHHL
jgi:hypothetical protein